MTSKTQLTGIAATHLVAARLSLLGYNAAVTSRNAAGTDVLVENPATARSLAIQVKANRIRRGSFVTGSATSPRGRIFVFVTIESHEKPMDPEFYVVRGADVNRIRKHKKRRNSDWYWVEIKGIPKRRDPWAPVRQALGPPSKSAL